MGVGLYEGPVRYAGQVSIVWVGVLNRRYQVSRGPFNYCSVKWSSFRWIKKSDANHLTSERSESIISNMSLTGFLGATPLEGFWGYGVHAKGFTYTSNCPPLLVFYRFLMG